MAVSGLLTWGRGQVGVGRRVDHVLQQVGNGHAAAEELDDELLLEELLDDDELLLEDGVPP